MTKARPIDERIREFIIRKFPLAGKRGIQISDPLLENGLLDSLGVLDVVSFLEHEFSITFSDEELVPENFHTIQSLAAFVQKKENRSSIE